MTQEELLHQIKMRIESAITVGGAYEVAVKECKELIDLYESEKNNVRR